MSIPSFKFKDLPPLPPKDESNTPATTSGVEPISLNHNHHNNFDNTTPSTASISRSPVHLTQQSATKSKRPPPLLNLLSTNSNKLVSSSNQSSPSSSATSATFLSSKPSIVVKQQSSASMLSSLNINAPTPFLEEKTMNRRNIKHLVLEDSSSATTATNNNNTTGPNLNLSLNSTKNSSLPQLRLGNFSSNSSKISINNSDLDEEDNSIPKYPFDPERKITTNELIENIQNLELGLEYQIDIKPSELVTLKKLGSGNSGTVAKVLHLPTQKIMARKTIHVETKEIIQSQIIRELRIMHECDSSFIIGFYGAFLHEGDVVICMEYVDCRSLDKVFQLTGPFPEFILKHVAFSVLSGLNYLYDNHRIIHRDIKPSNVLFNSKGNVKLCDFGVSRELINSMADTFVGTSTYMSPERIQGGLYTIKGDVWSLGLMLYELASGKFAFGGGGGQIGNKNNNSNGSDGNNSNGKNHNNKIKDFKRGPDSILDLLQSIVNEKPPTLRPEDGFSVELCDFVRLCLLKEKERPDPHELMKHPWLQDFVIPGVSANDYGNFEICSKYSTEIKRWAKNVRRLQKGKPVK